ncbi:DUF389 domain-containing protein [Leptospira sanjuanensis]|uniref:DUF389 domain-containing protein n=1 Tax=Leptospira sanjuanensis TaxID=2879643 RepID=UPI003872AD2D
MTFKGTKSPSFSTIFRQFVDYTVDLFHIVDDTDQKGTVDAIKKGVEFKGVNVWTLIIAIFIASIGLNTNSTAVIIGAMLISPLMGPILGAGLALGIYDFSLLNKSLKNVAVMTVLSLGASAIYFWLSPLSDAQSELLARTYPTIYDVLIASLGGLAGIIAASRKDKTSNAIPGVAIATALMPPLCTAGYGLANLNLKYFLGAIYLYLINCVFIGISTLIAVRYLKFKKITYPDKETEKRIARYVYAISLILLLPSLILAYDLIKESTFKKNARIFIDSNFKSEKSRILSVNFRSSGGSKQIEISIIGEPLSESVISHLESSLPQFGLEETELKIIQPFSSEEKQETFSKDLGLGINSRFKTKDEKIIFLENEIRSMNNPNNLIPKITKEINILFPNVRSFSFGDLLVQNVQDLSSTKENTILVEWKPATNKTDKKRLELYLKSRLNIETIKVLEIH